MFEVFFVICLFAAFSACYGLCMFKSRKGMSMTSLRLMAWMFSVVLGVATSFIVALACGFKTIGGICLQTLLMVVFFFFYYLICSRVYGDLMFAVNGGDNESYSEWSTKMKHREKARLKRKNYDYKVEGACGLVVFIIVTILMIAMYLPEAKINNNFIVSPDAVENASLEFSKGTCFYGGLPETKNNLIWQSPESFKLSNAKIYLVEDRRDCDKKYWYIEPSKQSDDTRRHIPIVLNEHDFVIVDDYSVVVRRSDGEIIK